jgi:predicted ATP-grasp superfamily ATP-dependent carboligase
MSRQTTRGIAVVPVINAASSVACLRSLGRQGVETLAITADNRVPGLASKYCGRTTVVPDPVVDLPAYEDRLCSLVERPDVRTVVPVREADVYVLAKHRDTIRATLDDGDDTPWPGLDRLGAVQDRVRLFEAAENAGVSAPETRPLDDWDDWDRDVVVKARYTVDAPEYSGGDVARLPGEKTQYVERRPDTEALVEAFGHVPLVQELVPSTDEYGFFALYDDGEAVTTFQHRQTRGYKYTGGPSAYRESIADPELESAGRALLDHLDWHGPAMVEFLRNPDTGEFELMEVNPRFWTSLPFTVKAGVDFPSLYWLQATGHLDDVEVGDNYDVGVAGHFLRGEVLYLHSLFGETYPLVDRPPRAKATATVAVSLLRHPWFDLVDLDDPGPFVRDARNLLAAAARRRHQVRGSSRRVARSVERMFL